MVKDTIQLSEDVTIKDYALIQHEDDDFFVDYIFSILMNKIDNEYTSRDNMKFDVIKEKHSTKFILSYTVDSEEYVMRTLENG